MEENTQEDSVNIQEMPQAPAQTPPVGYNDMHTPVFQLFHPIPQTTPVLYIPHPDYTQLPSTRINNPFPVHPAATPEHRPLNGPLSREAGEEEKSRLTVKEKVNKVLNLLKSFKLTHHFLLKPLRWKYEHHDRIFWVQYLQTRQEDGID